MSLNVQSQQYPCRTSVVEAWQLAGTALAVQGVRRCRARDAECTLARAGAVAASQGQCDQQGKTPPVLGHTTREHCLAYPTSPAADLHRPVTTWAIRVTTRETLLPHLSRPR